MFKHYTECLPYFYIPLLTGIRLFLFFYQTFTSTRQNPILNSQHRQIDSMCIRITYNMLRCSSHCSYFNRLKHISQVTVIEKTQRMMLRSHIYQKLAQTKTPTTKIQVIQNLDAALDPNATALLLTEFLICVSITTSLQSLCWIILACILDT